MRPTILLALFLCGCATKASDVTVPGPPAYKEGYANGCDSGDAAAGNPYNHFTKDPSLYLADAMYKQGWDDGFATCKGQYEAIGRAMN